MTIASAMEELVEKVRELGIGDFFDGMDYDDIIEMGLYRYGKYIEDNLSGIMKDMEITDSESINPGDYTQCSTCPSMITWEDFARNNGQCLECSPADSEDENLEIESDDLWDDDYLTDWVGDMGDN